MSPKTLTSAAAIAILSIASIPFSTSVEAQSNHYLTSVNYDYATVLSAEPIYRIVEHLVPHQQCTQKRVRYYDDSVYSPTSTIIGGLIGAAIGHGVGHHKRNKQVGAFAGALLGGTIGRDLGKKNHGSRHRTEQHCETYNEITQEEKLSGYNVTYRYNGQNHSVRTKRHPGDSIKIKTTVTPVF